MIDMREMVGKEMIEEMIIDQEEMMVKNIKVKEVILPIERREKEKETETEVKVKGEK